MYTKDFFKFFRQFLFLAILSIQSVALATPVAMDETSKVSTLKELFEVSWMRQPEAHSLAARRQAVQSLAESAEAIFPQAPNLEVTNRTATSSGAENGGNELEVSVAMPIWLPGQRAATVKLSESQKSAMTSRTTAAQLKLAENVRDTWWNWRRAEIAVSLASAQLNNAKQIVVDVAKRNRAGDLAKSDLHQANSAMLVAESALAQAKAAEASAYQQIIALTGGLAPRKIEISDDSEQLPEINKSEVHPYIKDLENRVTVALNSAALQSSQNRANPEVTVGASKDTGSFNLVGNQTILLKLKIPFGDGPRYDYKVAAANAEAIELQAQLKIERSRVIAQQNAAVARVDAANVQFKTAKKRALLASETRGFFYKSFRLGETDLPSLLRVEAEFVEANRQKELSKIELAAAISSLRQATGLLP